MKLQLRSSFVIFVTTTAVVALEAPPLAYASGDSPKYLMAAMGDSITAGFLAATSAAPFNPEPRQMSMLDTTQPPETHYTFPINVALKVLESRGTLSWSTGRSISSHRTLLETFLHKTEPKAKLASLNVALSGGLTIDLLRQADAIVKEMKTGKYKSLKYVTLLIGNNDTCTGNSDENMTEALHETFWRLSQIKQAEPIRVLMSGTPRIPDTGEPQIKASRTILGLTCDTFRTKVTNSCLAMTTWKTEAEHAQLLEFAQGKNELLAQTADQANHDFPNLNVVFSNQLFNQPIAIRDLAIDCFHPNAGSQTRISQELWLDQPWFR